MQSHGNSYVAGASIGWTFRQVRDQAKRLGARIAEIDIDADTVHAQTRITGGWGQQPRCWAIDPSMLNPS